MFDKVLSVAPKENETLVLPELVRSPPVVELIVDVEKKISWLVGDGSYSEPNPPPYRAGSGGSLNTYSSRLKRLICRVNGEVDSLRVWVSGRDVTSFEFKSTMTDGRQWTVTCNLQHLRDFIHNKRAFIELSMRRGQDHLTSMVQNTIYNGGYDFCNPQSEKS